MSISTHPIGVLIGRLRLHAASPHDDRPEDGVDDRVVSAPADLRADPRADPRSSLADVLGDGGDERGEGPGGHAGSPVQSRANGHPEGRADRHAGLHAELHGEAACAAARSIGIPAEAWTPENEADVVPAVLVDVCDRCPVWQACLLDAIRMNDVGYRASTTTSQRRLLVPDCEDEPDPLPPPTSEDLSVERRPRHPRGEGSMTSYRRGCRCDECRAHNAAARRRERARAS